ncbi:unnamed protein product [Rotaria sordida]|uniref:Uncharacterized protein n=1 Tax=Rotaria sordida TaxID=392033 RepID=A0A816E5K2_9BILA|nr:unnamed protein product [Rotaria sordida]CAF1642416.1 unnamed protein product [Rotaria sordida]
MTIIGYNRRLSIVIILLASLAVLLVATSVAAFVYVTRREKVLRKSHLISVIIIIFVELAFLIAVVSCCSIQSKNIQGQILAALLIVLSFLALMTLIYFLLEDVLKERIQPCPNDTTTSKSFTVQETKPTSRHESPIPVPIGDTAIPITTPPILPSFPRIPTPPLPRISSPLEKPATPSLPPMSSSAEQLATSSSEPLETVPSKKPTSPLPTKPLTPLSVKNLSQLEEPFPPYISNYDKIRRDLLAAIEERTIPSLEEAVRQVKDYNYIHQLKYECERALELLNRLMKIEHMRFSPVLWGRIKVLRLNQSTIAELHSYAKPPDEVSTVMRATFLLLGHSEKEIQDWPQIQNILGRFGRESVRRRCYELNPLSIPVDKAREAKDILKNYDLIRVTEISVGLSAFFNWAMTMIEEREKLLESQRRIIR